MTVTVVAIVAGPPAKNAGHVSIQAALQIEKDARVTEPNKWTYGLFARLLRIFLCLEVFAFVWDKNLYDALSSVTPLTRTASAPRGFFAMPAPAIFALSMSCFRVQLLRQNLNTRRRRLILGCVL